MHPSTRLCSCLLGIILFFGAAIHLLVVDAQQQSQQQQQNTSRGQTTRQNGIEDPNQGEDPCQVVAEVISDLGFLSYTQTAVQSAGLLPSFRSKSLGVTFLAPTNQGFARAANQLGFESVRELLMNRAVVRRIIEQHLLPFVVTINELEPGQILRTMDFGSPLTVQRGSDNKALEFAGSGGTSTQLRVIIDYKICKASIILVDNALIPADVFAMRELESRLPDPSPRMSTDSRSQTGGSMSTGTANVGSRPNDGSGNGGDSLNENNDYEIDEPNAMPARLFETDSISLEYPDYDFEDFIVDFPADGPRQVPTVGVRVPPLQRAP